MPDINRRDAIINGLTATAVSLCAAITPAHSLPSVPLTSTALRSKRGRRLLDLYRKIDLYEADVEADVTLIDEAAREVYAIMDDIAAAPAAGPVGLEEHAASVLYWYRPGPGRPYNETCPVTRDVLALVTSAFTHAGGAHA